MKIARFRLSQAWQASTTHRRARPAREAELVFHLLAPGARELMDVGGEPVGIHEFPGILVVVGLV